MSADRWTFFDKLARRTLGDGATDAEALGVIREHMRPLPPTFWPASTDAEALERIAAIRDTLPPERTEAEAWGMLDAALAHYNGSAPAPTPRKRGRPRWTDDLFAVRWRDACERSGPPYTYVHVAPEFEWTDGAKHVDADPDYLGRLWRKHGKPDPAP